MTAASRGDGVAPGEREQGSFFISSVFLDFEF